MTLINRNFGACVKAVAISCLFYSNGNAQSAYIESVARGKRIYINECTSCHMENGQGIPGAFPPLAGSDYFATDISKAIDVMINGLEGELEVNGSSYFGVMEPVSLSDQEIADVLNYIGNSWDDTLPILTSKKVSELKKANE